ncbi:MAG: hypothetical protein EZS28_015354 [Streblomastix strix]|uniref:Uncharacterized protein n=1 Tax=Streblomastix strix TaxID=222440 RepID=A0A5J4W378_9EUKA|nr:MAG: hypothetical protein EZS28_015354 [Streblomastix strix]
MFIDGRSKIQLATLHGELDILLSLLLRADDDLPHYLIGDQNLQSNYLGDLGLSSNIHYNCISTAIEGGTDVLRWFWKFCTSAMILLVSGLICCGLLARINGMN